MSYSAKIGFGPIGQITSNIQNGEIDEHDVVFTQDTHEIIYVDGDKNQLKMGSRIPLFINKSTAISQLNVSTVTYDGQPVGIRNDNGNYELYTVYHNGNHFAVNKLSHSDDVEAISLEVANHTENNDIHITASERVAWNNKANSQQFDAHINDSDIHVTINERDSWNAKADNSALESHVSDNGIHITGNEHDSYNTHVQDSDIHVTANDKARWSSMGTYYQTLVEFKSDLVNLDIQNAKHVFFSAVAISALTNNKITSSCYGIMCKTSASYYDINLCADGYLFFMVRIDANGDLIRVARATLTTI